VKYWWLSFCDPDLPRGQTFLGVCIVAGEGIGDAAREAHRLGCNPGGEVQGMPIPDYLNDHVAEYVGKLMNREECDALDKKLLSIS
jgi:hypothetical protein